jgi:hypothetical protein
MNLLIDSFWRAAVYCLRPGVIVLSFLPLLLIGVSTLLLGYFFWDNALEHVRAWLEASELLQSGWAWLDSMGWGGIKTVLAPLIVIFFVTPLIVVACLLVVTVCMTPYLVRLVAKRRFPALERRAEVSFLQSAAWSLTSAVLALIALVVSIPLWLIPPLVLILPPLIWGWLTYRVMAFDALAEHATAHERRLLMKEHRFVFLGMGVLAGLMGAAPSLMWVSATLFAAMFVIFLPLALWIYTLIFIFSALWFTHYGLAALDAHRALGAPGAAAEPVMADASAQGAIDLELPQPPLSTQPPSLSP